MAASKPKQSPTPTGVPGSPDDYLYVIAGGEFYRLSPKEVRKHKITGKNKNDVDVVKALTDLAEKNAVVADLPGDSGLGAAASCICVVLNIDIFEGSLQTKVKKATSKK